MPNIDLEEVVILFAGDSGDGIQLTGGQFTETVEMKGNDITTFPNFPAEIRAPLGTLSGVSGYQLKFGSVEVFTPGDQCDVLVTMNSAALKVNLHSLKKGGIIIANTSGFDSKNLKLAKYADGENPLTDNSLDDFDLHPIDITKMTREALKESELGQKGIDKCKNMFVLGFIYWMFNQETTNSIKFIEAKFASKPAIAEANIKAIKAGYNLGDTLETFNSRFEVKPAQLPKGDYRNITGNQGVAIGMVAAAIHNKLDLFYGSYPITPASVVLQELSKYKNYGVKTFQAEDEIAAMCSIIGAAFGGALSATASSGPGIALKGEAMGLAVMLELPMVIVNVQRGGPSTGLPTKTEQSDLMQAIYGRNGEAPMPVLAIASPNDSFDTTYLACKIAIEHMTPVMVLSDGYIGNGSEPWKYPSVSELEQITPRHPKEEDAAEFLPYKRDEQLVRSWATPGMANFVHRIGGLEKEIDTGNVSYDPDNHEQMVHIRAKKIEKIAETQKAISIEEYEGFEILVLGWGSTYGAIQTAVRALSAQDMKIAHLHLRMIYPFPKNLGEVLSKFKRILIPEMNKGQLASLIKQEFLVEVESIQKIKGMPFNVNEIKNAILNNTNNG
jgi:2-oxoglutarate ferredoxin oxidoreductase subunit alpha